MAALKIIIILSVLQCLQIEAILNKGKHYQRLPYHIQKRLTESSETNNSEAEDHSKGTHLQEPDDFSQNFVKDLAKADDGYTISRNINKASAKGLTVLEVNFIKNNYYLKDLPFNKANKTSNTVNKKLDKTVKNENNGKAAILPRGSEDMLKVVNIGNKVNNTEHVIDKIVFPDTNITAFLNSHDHRVHGLKKNGEQTDSRLKSSNDETVNKNLNRTKNITLDSTENVTDIPTPITNAPIVEPQNNAKGVIHKKFVLVPVLPEGNGDGLFQFQEGKPITFYPVSVDKIKEYARDSSKDNGAKNDDTPAPTNTRDVHVQDINGNRKIDDVSSTSSWTGIGPIL